jgi:hypothetical protein
MKYRICLKLADGETVKDNWSGEVKSFSPVALLQELEARWRNTDCITINEILYSARYIVAIWVEKEKKEMGNGANDNKENSPSTGL